MTNTICKFCLKSRYEIEVLGIREGFLAVPVHKWSFLLFCAPRSLRLPELEPKISFLDKHQINKNMEKEEKTR